MSWGRRMAAMLAAVAFGGVLGTGAADAAAADTVCGTASTPAGWVEVKYWDSSQCGATGGAMYNTKMIIDTNGTASGGTVSACTYSPIPSGFHITRYSTISDCYRSRGASDYHNQVTLVRLSGLPAGATATICGLVDVPAGWTVISRRYSSDCQQYRGGLPASDNTVTIRKS